MSLWSADGATLFVGDPSPVFASARRAAAQSIASGVSVAVDLDTSDFAIGHSTSVPTVNLTSNTIVPSVSGYYRISARGGIDTAGGGKVGETLIGIRVAASSIAETRGSITATAGVYSSFVSAIAYVTAGSAIDFVMYQATGGSLNTATSAQYQPCIQVELMR